MAERETKAATEEAAATATPDPERIEAEIEQTRDELGETVGALADKTDVKKQAKQKAQETKDAASERASEAAQSAKQAFEGIPDQAGEAKTRAVAAARENPVPAAIGAGVALAVVVMIVRRARR